MSLNQPLSQRELDELADFLDSDHAPFDAMDISMLDGYLTAVAIGPVVSMPSKWYPRIWGGMAKPAFDSLEQAQHILTLITRRYNGIVRTFLESTETFEPYLYEYKEKGKWIPSAEDWCIGFSLGVELQSEAWQPLLDDEESSGMLAPIVAFSMEEAWDEVTKGRNPAEVREELIAALPVVVHAIHAYWLPFREKRKPGLVPDSFRLGGKAKAGRKASPPRTSHRKSKKGGKPQGKK